MNCILASFIRTWSKVSVNIEYEEKPSATFPCGKHAITPSFRCFSSGFANGKRTKCLLGGIGSTEKLNEYCNVMEAHLFMIPSKMFQRINFPLVFRSNLYLSSEIYDSCHRSTEEKHSTPIFESSARTWTRLQKGKKTCCRVEVNISSQPIFKNVQWTNRTFPTLIRCVAPCTEHLCFSMNVIITMELDFRLA